MRNEQKSSVRLSTFLPRVLAWLQHNQSVASSTVPFLSKKLGPTESDAAEPPQRLIVSAAESESALDPEDASRGLVDHPSGAALADLPEQNAHHNRNRLNLLRHPWLVALFVSSGTGICALFWIASLPPLPNCQQISPLAADAERLYCADQAARQGDVQQLIGALKTVSDWPEDHPLSPQASHLRDEWSRSVLSIANQKQQQGKLKEALSLARRVPSTSPVHTEAQANLQAWEEDWDQGNAIHDQVQAALKTQQWEQAVDHLKPLVQLNNDYWRRQIKQLNAQIATERLAWKRLQQAQDIAGFGTAEDLAAAIALVRQVGSNSYAAKKAKAELEGWSKRLVAIARERLEYSELQGAITAAEKIPPSTPFYLEAQDIVHVGQAETLGQKDQLLAYMSAWALTRQIPPERRLYERAQAKTAVWEQQIQNLTQVQLAKWFASLNQSFGYQLAIDHAQMIEADQPRRLQAQTLIAQWRQQLAKLEDLRYLARALQLAAAGTLESFQAAIAQAGQITLGRALRLEAQTLIAEWTQKLKVLQDQPILNQARALAKQGKISKAVEIAQQIAADRPLYTEAQAAISEWVGQQAPKEQAILDEATALAREGNLTAAINTAAQIPSEGALYYEAQDAIALWAAERDVAPPQPQEAEPVPAPPPSDTEVNAPVEDNLPIEEPVIETTPPSPEAVTPTPESSPTVDSPVIDNTSPEPNQ